MTVSKSSDSASQQPIDKACGLLAACIMVFVGGWIGLRPETILVRSLVVGATVTAVVRILIRLVQLANSGSED